MAEAGGEGGAAAGCRPGAPGPDGFAICTQLASDVQSTAPTTVGIVTWSLDASGLTEAHIDFGLDTTYGVTAPVDLTATDYRTVLFGMKPARTYHFRIVATDGSQSYTSDDQTLTTGAATTVIQAPTVTVMSADQVDQGFIIGSFWTGNANWTAFIIDTDGDVVWWYTDTSDSAFGGSGFQSIDGIGRARLSANSHDIWLVNGQSAKPIRRVSIDTLDVQSYPDATGTHDICAVSGDKMAFLASNAFPATCASIVEIDKTGATNMVFDSTGVTNGKCHGNSLRYVQAQDVYTFSDRNTDVFVVDRTGAVQWKLSDKVSGGNAFWGGVQHGVHLLGSSILIFANEVSDNANGSVNSQVFEFGLDGTVIKQFTSRGGTDFLGDVQRLPSGNTLINYSIGKIQEVDPNDNVVLEVDIATPNASDVGYTEFRSNLYGPPIDIAQQ